MWVLTVVRTDTGVTITNYFFDTKEKTLELVPIVVKSMRENCPYISLKRRKIESVEGEIYYAKNQLIDGKQVSGDLGYWHMIMEEVEVPGNLEESY